MTTPGGDPSHYRSGTYAESTTDRLRNWNLPKKQSPGREKKADRDEQTRRVSKLQSNAKEKEREKNPPQTSFRILIHYAVAGSKTTLQHIPFSHFSKILFFSLSSFRPSISNQENVSVRITNFPNRFPSPLFIIINPNVCAVAEWETPMSRPHLSSPPLFSLLSDHASLFSMEPACPLTWN